MHRGCRSFCRHGFYTACGTQPATSDDRWPWPHATPGSATLPLCGDNTAQDMRSRGVGSQAQQAIMLSRAFLVNAMSGVAATLWYDWRDEKDDNSSKTNAFGLIHVRRASALSLPAFSIVWLV